MIRAVLHTLRLPHEFVKYLAERNLETKDDLFSVLIVQDKAAERSARHLTRRIRKVRSTDPITGRLRGDYPQTPTQRKKPS